MASLKEYNKKRNFNSTAEPAGRLAKGKKAGAAVFVVQEHHASHLHYDFRLELDGVLKSWAVPKGPSLNPKEKRLAVEVEDHPLDYASFEGVIPEDEYGGGEVFLWDEGKWSPEKDPHQGLEKGRLEFELKGKKLKGRWLLLRTNRQTGKKRQWLLIKRTDDFAQTTQIEPVGKSASSGQADKEKSKKTASKKSATKKKSTTKTASSRDLSFDFVAPQLATLVKEPPEGEEWLHEVKFDGYRLQAHIEKGQVKLFTRAGNDWSHRFPDILKALGKNKKHRAVLDGELVAVDAEGRTDFQVLQNSMENEKTSQLVYYAFDLISYDEIDLRREPLQERKRRLKTLISTIKAPQVRYSDDFAVEGKGFLSAACKWKFEGIISKLKDAPYASGRGTSWVKSKCGMRQEFVIGGFTDPQGARTGFGALLVGVYEEGVLRYAGKVGTGFDNANLLELHKKLKKIEIDDSPFDLKSPRGSTIHWVKPQLVAEVAFANWTSDRVLRVPVFHGLREDKPATEIVQEVEKESKALPQKGAKAVAAAVSAANISHPDKIIYKKEKITKERVAEYYAEVSSLMLPHLEKRPLSLYRCPEGTSGACFFQKHMNEKMPEAIKKIAIEEKNATRNYSYVENAEGILGFVQRGVLEFHPWNSRVADPARADQFIMDLDPDGSLKWNTVVDAAFEVRALLKDLHLESFVKVTGGKGIHLQVPIAARYDWTAIKDFTHTIATHLAQENPKLYLAKSSKASRTNKIFVDYLRNSSGATAVSPYSLRAREISAAAIPVKWDELRDLGAANVFTLDEALKYLKKRKKDPWEGYFDLAQPIEVLEASTPGKAEKKTTKAKKKKASK